MLSKAHREELRAIILEEIQSLEESLESLTAQSQTVAPDNALGRLTRMDAIVQQSTAEHLKSDAIQRMTQLRKRLEEIDSPEYGLCARCHEPIAIERLKAVPNAPLCIACASAASRQ